MPWCRSIGRQTLLLEGAHAHYVPWATENRGDCFSPDANSLRWIKALVWLVFSKSNPFAILFGNKDEEAWREQDPVPHKPPQPSFIHAKSLPCSAPVRKRQRRRYPRKSVFGFDDALPNIAPFSLRSTLYSTVRICMYAFCTTHHEPSFAEWTLGRQWGSDLPVLVHGHRKGGKQ